ncbi:MAG: hypothetical protein CUN54_09500 [Phototrophicales bacterium]|nr:MAG: hypothetical protein CUN54_09500 [Phototrophicales bacterium]
MTQLDASQSMWTPRDNANVAATAVMASQKNVYRLLRAELLWAAAHPIVKILLQHQAHLMTEQTRQPHFQVLIVVTEYQFLVSNLRVRFQTE